MKAIFALALFLLLFACTQVEEQPRTQEVVEKVVQQEVVPVKSAGGIGEIVIAALPVSRTKDNVRVRMKITDVKLQHENGVLLLTNESFEIPQGDGRDPGFLFEKQVPVGKYNGLIFSFTPLIEEGGKPSPAITSGNTLVAPIQVLVNEVGKTLVVIGLDSSASVFTTVKKQKVLLPVFNLRSSDSVNANENTILSEHVISEHRYGLDLSGKTQSGAPVGKNTLLDVIDGKIVKATLVQPEIKPLVKKLKNVQITGRELNPSELTVEAGTTVTWNNAGTADHILEFNNGEKSQIIKGGAGYSRTFSIPGNYKYKCGIHKEMKGKIIVA